MKYEVPTELLRRSFASKTTERPKSAFFSILKFIVL